MAHARVYIQQYGHIWILGNAHDTLPDTARVRRGLRDPDAPPQTDRTAAALHGDTPTPTLTHAALLQNLRESRRILVTGEGGIGKTEITRAAAFELARAFEHSPISAPVPLRIELQSLPLRRFDTRRDKHRHEPLLEAILAVTPTLASAQNGAAIEQLCASNRLVLILDGLDELNPRMRKSEFEPALAAALDGPLRHCGLLLAGRPSALSQGITNLFPKSDRWTPSVLLNEQIESYIRAHFVHRDPSLGAQLIRELRAAGASVRELIRRPLMLALLCLQVENGQVRLPNSPADVMERAVLLLLSRRRVRNVKAALTALGELALLGFDRRRRSVTDTVLPHLACAERIEDEALLAHLAQKSGFFFGRPETGYHFTNRALAEYLAARVLAKRKPESILDLFRHHIWNDDFEELFYWLAAELWLSSPRGSGQQETETLDSHRTLADRLVLWLLEHVQPQRHAPPASEAGAEAYEDLSRVLLARASRMLGAAGDGVLVDTAAPKNPTAPPLVHSARRFAAICRRSSTPPPLPYWPPHSHVLPSELADVMLQPWLRCLKSGPVSENVAWSLSSQPRLPEPMLHSLVEVMETRPAARSAAATALGRQLTLPPPIVSRLIDLMIDSKAARLDVALALGLHSSLPQRAITRLVELLEGSPQVREAAGEVLNGQLALSDRIVFRLVNLIESAGAPVRAAAAEALCSQSLLPEAAILRLVILIAKQSGASSDAAQALSGQVLLPDGIADNLFELWNQKKARRDVLWALSNQRSYPEHLLTQFVDCIQDDPEHRNAASEALSGSTPLPPMLIRRLVGMIERNAEVRTEAALALRGQSALPDSEVLRLVTLMEREADARGDAAQALSSQLTFPEAAVQRLLGLWRADPTARDEVARVLDEVLPARAEVVAAFLAAGLIDRVVDAYRIGPNSVFTGSRRALEQRFQGSQPVPVPRISPPKPTEPGHQQIPLAATPDAFVIVPRAKLALELPPPRENSLSTDTVPSRIDAAYRSFELAQHELGPKCTDRQAHAWLQDNAPAEYEVPDFQTWRRYLGHGRKHHGTQKNTPIAGREGRSVVKHTQLAPDPRIDG